MIPTTPSRLTWTTEPPTEPGWYWRRWGTADGFTKIVHLTMTDSGRLSDGEALITNPTIYEWSDAPIPEPVEPEAEGE